MLHGDELVIAVLRHAVVASIRDLATRDSEYAVQFWKDLELHITHVQNVIPVYETASRQAVGALYSELKDWDHELRLMHDLPPDQKPQAGEMGRPMLAFLLETLRNSEERPDSPQPPLG